MQKSKLSYNKQKYENKNQTLSVIANELFFFSSDSEVLGSHAHDLVAGF